MNDARPDDLGTAIEDVRHDGRDRDVRCPAHDDTSPSLSVGRSDDGRVLLHCHAGCEPESILQAAGLTWAEVMHPRDDRSSSRSRIIETYDYTDERRELLYQVCRMEPKSFRQRRPDGNGAWSWSVRGVRRVVYHLPDLQGCKVVYVVEGERDVDALWAMDIPATCNAGGAGKWTDDYTSQLVAAGVCKVVVLPDNDDPGHQHAEQVARSCHAAGLAVKVVELPDLPPKGDVSDWLNAGHTREDLVSDVKAATIYQPANDENDASPPPDPPREPTIRTELFLPPFPEDLLDLPHGLGDVQVFILQRMKYPSPATAGVAALATLTAFTQSHVTIDSFQGLGLNEQYLVLAPTGFGKEDLRQPIHVLMDRLDDTAKVPDIQWSAPSSLPGLHQLLEDHRSQFFLSDEFAEWLAQTGTDPNKQAALGYFMQLYTKSLSTVNAPNAVTRKYQPVRHPRVSVLATSTAERVLETMTLSHADAGAYNRWLIHVAEQERIEKRYRGLRFQPSQNVIELCRWLATHPETRVEFEADAWELYIEHDTNVIEPIKFEDNHLAGRLSEQAMKIAALIALSDHRMTIGRDDLEIAYRIREGLYHRTKAMAAHDGALSGMHATGQALEQVKGIFERDEYEYISRLPQRSRRYKALSVPQQHAVLTALEGAGIVEPVEDRKGLLRSRIYREGGE